MSSSVSNTPSAGGRPHIQLQPQTIKDITNGFWVGHGEQNKKDATICILGLTKLIDELLTKGSIKFRDTDRVMIEKESVVWPAAINSIVLWIKLDLKERGLEIDDPIIRFEESDPSKLDSLIVKTCKISLKNLPPTTQKKPEVTREPEEKQQETTK